MCDDIDRQVKLYKEFPDEANADAWQLQDACNLQAVARTFMCMTRAANFKYDNPAVMVTLDKMNHLCNMQGRFYDDDIDKKFDIACTICSNAFNQRVLKREVERDGI